MSEEEKLDRIGEASASVMERARGEASERLQAISGERGEPVRQIDRAVGDIRSGLGHLHRLGCTPRIAMELVRLYIKIRWEGVDLRSLPLLVQWHEANTRALADPPPRSTDVESRRRDEDSARKRRQWIRSNLDDIAATVGRDEATEILEREQEIASRALRCAVATRDRWESADARAPRPARRRKSRRHQR